MQWDLFCRVIDNYGDIGVCWRLAADLAGRGERVRLWVDDPSALEWMAPDGAAGVEVHRWTENAPFAEPGDAVVEAFGCELPDAFIERMARRGPPPAWINLEYLSAEDYVERSHGLLSPQFSGPGAGLRKHFYYPGFTARTGGLLREPGLIDARRAFERDAWLQARGLTRRTDEQVVSLFCYDNLRLAEWLADLTQAPTLLLVTPGLATAQLAQLLSLVPQPGAVADSGLLRVGWLEPLPQPEFDRLLWSCDVNFVRGEDSFVRAQWADRPFVWQIYPQNDGAHEIKLEAFLQRFLAGAEPELAARVAHLWRAWNGIEPHLGPWPPRAAWGALVTSWRETLLAEPDLTTQLLRFVRQTS